MFTSYQIWETLIQQTKHLPALLGDGNTTRLDMLGLVPIKTGLLPRRRSTTHIRETSLLYVACHGLGDVCFFLVRIPHNSSLRERTVHIHTQQHATSKTQPRQPRQQEDIGLMRVNVDCLEKSKQTCHVHRHSTQAQNTS